MSASDAPTGYQGRDARRTLPISCYSRMNFSSLYVAEPDSNRPAHFAALLRFLRRKGRSREDAEDLIQEAMLRLHAYAKESVQDKEAFLRRAVRNLAIDQFRHARARLCREVPIEDIDQESPLIAPGPSPDQVFEGQRRLDEVAARLNAVSSRTREIYLAYRMGYSYADIAAHMNIAEITIKRHIARARVVLMRVDD